jgi:hypothetical protein
VVDEYDTSMEHSWNDYAIGKNLLFGGKTCPSVTLSIKILHTPGSKLAKASVLREKLEKKSVKFVVTCTS